jgi:hypothetical protein
VDGRGHYYALAEPIGMKAGGQLTIVDSAAIERWSGNDSARDTVAFLGGDLPDDAQVMAGVIVAPRHAGRPVPAFYTKRQWAVSADGRVAIAYPEPYRVHYVDGGGRVSIGSEIPYERAEVSDAVKGQWWADRPTEVYGVMRGPTGVSRIRRPVALPQRVAWPAHLPPFLFDLRTNLEPVRFAPDGTLWIERVVVPGSLPLTDVIDDTGKLARRVRLPPDRRVVGFGRESVYLVRRDEVDLQYLERYELPARWH